MLTKIPEILKAQRYSWIVDAELNWRRNKTDREKINNILCAGIENGISPILNINQVIQTYLRKERDIMRNLLERGNKEKESPIQVVVHIHSYNICCNGYVYGMEA